MSLLEVLVNAAVVIAGGVCLIRYFNRRFDALERRLDRFEAHLVTRLDRLAQPKPKPEWPR